jgi:flavin-dependent dehydrogenase
VVGAVVDGAVIGARFTVDAAGGRHWLSRALGLPVRRHSRTLIARYGHATGRCPRLDGAPALMALGAGWLWTARVRIGLYAWVRLDLDAGAPLDASWRPEEFSGLEPLGSARGADVTWRRAEVFSGPGYVLAGDAAVTVDPLSSHGVLRALTSGMAAAHLMAGALRRGEPEGLGGMAYGRWLDAWFRRDIHSLSRHLGALQMAAPPPLSGVGPDWICSALLYTKVRSRPRLRAES